MNRYEALQSAVDKTPTAQVRAEDLEDAYEELFIDPVGIKELIGNPSQVLFGRKGSGKTTLLGALKSEIERDPGLRVQVFSYRADAFSSSPEFAMIEPTVKHEALAFFNSFLNQLATDLGTLAERTLFDQAAWTEYFTREGAKAQARRTSLLKALVELEQAARLGVESDIPSAWSAEMVEVSKSGGSKGGAGKASIEVAIGPRARWTT